MIDSGRNYDLALSANGAGFLDVVGDYLYLVSAGGKVRVQTDQAQAELLPGQGLMAPFNRIAVTDLSGAANAIVMFAGGKQFIDRRITGTVSVVDGAKARVIGQSSYIGLVTVTGGGATYGKAQLYNPPASGKNLILNQIKFSTSVAGIVALWRGNFALPTVGGYIQNKWTALTGAMPAVAEIRTEISATGGPPNIDHTEVPANVSFVQRFADPIVIVPGAAIFVVPIQFAAATRTVFEWFEEAV